MPIALERPRLYVPRHKPRPGTSVNWSHPLARGLTGAWLFYDDGNGGSRSMVNTADRLVASGGARYGARAPGVGLVGTASTSTLDGAILSSPSSQLKPTQNLTMFWRGVVLGDGGGLNPAGPLIAGMVYDNADGPPYSSYTIHRNATQTDILFEWNDAGTTGSLDAPNGLSASDYGSVMTLASVYGQSGTFGYKNGAQLVSGAGLSATGITYSTTSTLLVDRHILQAANTNVFTSELYIWNRMLSAAEVAWLTREPYVFLQPRGVTFISLPTGAAATSYRDTATRIRLASAAVVRDASSRFRLRSTTLYRDIATRLRLAATGYRDTVARFRLQSAVVWRDTSLRLRLQGQAWRDTTLRFRLQSATTWRDTSSRVRLQAQAWRDTAVRLRLQAQTWRDTSVRLKLLANGFRDSATRFALTAPGVFRDATSRFRLRSTNVYRDTTTRLRLQSVVLWRDTATRLRLNALSIRDVSARVRLQSATIWRDTSSRARLSSGITWRDVVFRLRINAGLTRDSTARVRLASARTRDTGIRLALVAAGQAANPARHRLADQVQFVHSVSDRLAFLHTVADVPAS